METNCISPYKQKESERLMPHVPPFQPKWATKLVMSEQEKSDTDEGDSISHLGKTLLIGAVPDSQLWFSWRFMLYEPSNHKIKSSKLYLKQRHLQSPDLTQGDDVHTYSGLKHLPSWHVKDTIARSCGEACPCMPAPLELCRVRCQYLYSCYHVPLCLFFCWQVKMSL